MRARTILLLVALVGCAKSSAPPLPGDSVAQDGSVALSPPNFSTAPADAPQPLGPIESKLFAPEVIMEHQSALGVSAEQKKTILDEVQRGQADMLHLQWDLNGDKEKLVAILDHDKVDEAAAGAQATRLMQDEDRIKASHLAMLIRVKNVLSADQQKKLRELRDAPVVKSPQGR